MSAFERPNFFTGKFLTADDFRLEQEYGLKKRRLHNQQIHGWGVVSGLEVKTKGNKIQISSGYALDCLGNEIVVTEPLELNAPAANDPRLAIYLGVTFEEQKVNAVTTSPSGDVEWERIVECVEPALLNTNCNAGHRRSGGRWIVCGTKHPIVVARLRKLSHGWRTDRRYRAPTIR